jgi:hypothetical protein
MSALVSDQCPYCGSRQVTDRTTDPNGWSALCDDCDALWGHNAPQPASGKPRERVGLYWAHSGEEVRMLARVSKGAEEKT